MTRRKSPQTAARGAPSSTPPVTKNLNIYWPDPRQHRYQLACLASRAQRKILRAGRRGGKTVTSAMEALAEFLGVEFQEDGTPRKVAEGGRVLYISPTSNQVDRFWFEVKQALRECLEVGMYYLNETKHIIEVPGTLFRIRAMTGWSPDHLRGDTADLLIFDEYQLMDEAIWSEVGAPMLMDTRGRALFIYTPPSLHSTARSKARDPRHAAKLFQKAQADTTGQWAVFHFSSHDNPYLPPGAVEEVAADMTRLAYEQEILALDKDEAPGAYWTHALIDGGRVERTPELYRIIVGVDPTGGIAECGIVAVGKARNGHYYVIADDSLTGTPAEWASAVVRCFQRQSADRVIAETNFGAEMVRNTIETVPGGKMVAFKPTNSARGKAIRASPVVSQYEQGKVHHVGTFPFLEEQMCLWEDDGKHPSPDRIDALVFAIKELMGAGRTATRRIPVRGLYSNQKPRYNEPQMTKR